MTRKLGKRIVARVFYPMKVDLPASFRETAKPGSETVLLSIIRKLAINSYSGSLCRQRGIDEFCSR